MRTLLLASLLLLPALALADDQAIAKIDALYAKRNDPAAMKEHDAALAEALKANPNDYALLWRAARMKYYIADGLPNGDARKRAGREAWDAAERALKANPKGVEASYYAAVSIGAYSEAVGILSALAEGLEGKFNERLDYAIKMNSTLDHCGPLMAKGRYYFELPWPKRDVAKSIQMFEKSIEKCPESLRGYVYLAESLVDDGKTKEAKEAIAKALNGSTAYDPVEGQHAKESAKKLVADKKDLR